MRFRRNFVFTQAFVIFLIVYLAKRSRDRHRHSDEISSEHNVQIPAYVDHNAGAGLFEDSANAINVQNTILEHEEDDGSMRDLFESINNKRSDMFSEPRENDTGPAVMGDVNVPPVVPDLLPPAPPSEAAAAPPAQNPPTYHFPVPGEELPLGDLPAGQPGGFYPNLPQPVIPVGGIETEIRQDNIANLDPARFSLQVTEDMINNFQIKLPPLLENYKNPCWIEETPEGFTYDDSYFNTCHYVPHTDKLKHGAQYKAFEKVLLNRTANGNRSRVRCFPYFFLIGVGKCGTTDIFDTLKKYFFELAPIFLKEPHYWEWKRCIDKMLCRGSHRTPTFAEYLDSFDSSSDYLGQRKIVRADGTEYHDMLIGDFTPSTLAFHPCWKLMPGNTGEVEPKYMNAHYIKAIRPETKFIAIMRDPVERIFSNFRMRDRMSASEIHHDAEDFHTEMSQVLKYLKNCMLTKSERACAYSLMKFDFGTHVTNSMYEIFISDWFKIFPREQFLFLKMEDYMESRVPNFRKIVDFLGLEQMPPEKELMISSKSIVNKAPPAAMFNETRLMLQDFFRSFNQRLAHLLEDDSWTWGY